MPDKDNAAVIGTSQCQLAGVLRDIEEVANTMIETSQQDVQIEYGMGARNN